MKWKTLPFDHCHHHFIPLKIAINITAMTTTFIRATSASSIDASWNYSPGPGLFLILS
jgi:hypothetical protein